MQTRPNMQIVGENIAQLRREKNLSTYAFARALQQPMWLIALVETAYSEHSKQLLDQLPASVVDMLFKGIQRVFGISVSRLTTSIWSQKLPSTQQNTARLEPLLLPVAFTPEDAIDSLDELVKLVSSGSSNGQELSIGLYQHFQSTLLLDHLQQRHQQKNSQSISHNAMNRSLRQRLRQRIEHWQRSFAIANRAPEFLYCK